jgi:hypothetical protein
VSLKANRRPEGGDQHRIIANASAGVKETQAKVLSELIVPSISVSTSVLGGLFGVQ